MPPRVMTQSARQPIAESRGRETGIRVGRGGRGRGLGEVGNQGNVGNQNGNVVNENVQENVRNVLVNGNQSMQEASGTHLDMSTAYHPQTDESIVRQLYGMRLEKKSHAVKKRKPLEFSVGDYILLKVLPWKGVVNFRKNGKLAPRFVGPFEIIEKVGLVAYREFKKLKRSRIAMVKVRWNSKRGPKFTWELEDQMKLKYPHLFSDGPKQLGNYIYVYLEPLIDDMIDLWDKGVEVYDEYKKQQFKLFTMIFCIISDFLAYANLSGYGTKGDKACPVCEKDTHSRWLTNSIEPKTMQKVVQISGVLTSEAVRNGSIKKVKKRENMWEPSKDKNGKDDNKRTRTGNAFASTANPIGRENMGVWLKCTTCNSYHTLRGPCRTCFDCNLPGHLAKDCRGVLRSVNPVNARNLTVRACYQCGSIDHVRLACPRLNRVQGPEGNRPNQVVANNGGQGCRNQGNQARGRAIRLGAEEARQDPNFMTGIEPSELGFKYEIEIGSGQLVKIDKVIKSYKLEIKGHVFDIDLIPFGHGSFDVIISIDWLSNHKAKIICHKKVVRIPLLDGK
nr:hypothetical protein [Tanacetum cinerariifolium]